MGLRGQPLSPWRPESPTAATTHRSPRRGSRSAAESSVSRPLAPGATTMMFSPAESTMTTAVAAAPGYGDQARRCRHRWRSGARAIAPPPGRHRRRRRTARARPRVPPPPPDWRPCRRVSSAPTPPMPSRPGGATCRHRTRCPYSRCPPRIPVSFRRRYGVALGYTNDVLITVFGKSDFTTPVRDILLRDLGFLARQRKEAD